MKIPYATACFAIDLDETWMPEGERPEEGGLTFVTRNNDARLYISAGLINAGDRDLAKTAAEMNAHTLGSIAAQAERAGGKLQRDAPTIAAWPPGYEVAIAAAVDGPPELKEEMVLVTALHPWVWALVRLSSKSLPRQELLRRWGELRLDFALVKATRK